MGTLDTVSKLEGKVISDVIKSEFDQTHNRDEVDLKANADLDVGDVVELISTKYEKLVTAANAAGVFLNKSNPALVKATGQIQFAAIPSDLDTVTINGRVYEFRTTLGTGDDRVLIGATVETAMDNLTAAINGGTGAGTEYDPGTPVQNADMIAKPGDGDTVDLEAVVPGSAGNSLTLAESGTNTTVSGATLTGGGATDPAKGVIIIRGPATLDGTQLAYNGQAKAAADTALQALGLKIIG